MRVSIDRKLADPDLLVSLDGTRGDEELVGVDGPEVGNEDGISTVADTSAGEVVAAVVDVVEDDETKTDCQDSPIVSVGDSNSMFGIMAVIYYVVFI